jgi:hypothetical protein
MFFDMQRKSQYNRKCALVAIDPHGDFAQRLLYFAHNTDRDRLVYISSSINREAETTQTYTAIVNPFQHDGTEHMKYLLAQELTDALAELLADTAHSMTVQMTALLRPAIYVTLCSAHPSMETLARFFLDKDGMNSDLIELGKKSAIPQYRTFFEHDFHANEYVLTKRSIRTKLLYFLADPMLANMLNGKCTVNISDCLEQGKVVIFNLPKGSGKFTSSVFSRLMIAYIHALILRRDAIEPKYRKQCYLFLDEFQTMLTNSLTASLAETRKYALSLILATQSVKQIDKPEMRKVVMLNTNLKAVSMTDYEDKVIFSREFGISADEIGKLEPLQFYIKKNDGKHTAFKFTVPILKERYFLSKQERKELLHYLVYQSGIYVKVPLTLPPSPPSKPNEPLKPKDKKPKSEPKKKIDDNPFDEDFLKPAFTT